MARTRQTKRMVTKDWSLTLPCEQQDIPSKSVYLLDASISNLISSVILGSTGPARKQKGAHPP